ncbi:MAG: hypothetical protein KIT48_08965 [Pseudolabrys sp.]|nr:hypothetical protein [Pseudolabrys sp.]
MLNLMFLGQRQIAWNAIAEILKPVDQQALKLVAFVSDLATWERLREEFGEVPAHFIPNDQRRTTEILKTIEERNVNILISVQHNWILSQDILDSVKGQAFNLHNARLPHYQGYNSISHAIINGDETFYSTIHWMEGAVDTGDIAYEEETTIAPTDTALSLHRKTITAASRAFARLLNDLRSNHPIPRRKIQNGPSQFYGKNSIKGILDITAECDPVMIDRLARGLFYPPYNAAYRLMDARKIWEIPEAGLPDLLEFGLTRVPPQKS